MCSKHPTNLFARPRTSASPPRPLSPPSAPSRDRQTICSASSGYIILDGDSVNSVIQVSTKADRVSSTNPSGILVYTKLNGRQILQGPQRAYPTVQEDMVLSEYQWNVESTTQSVVTNITASKHSAKNGVDVVALNTLFVLHLRKTGRTEDMALNKY